MRTYEPKAPTLVQPKLVVGTAGGAFEAAADRAADAVVTGWRTGAALEPAVTSGSVGAGGGGGALDDETSRGVHTARRGGSPLQAATRSPMEDAFGADFSAVRVHADDRAGELCSRLRAQAFTIGSDVFFRAGRPDPSSPAGRHLLAHELAHVVQQSPVIRRSYIDGGEDWVWESTKYSRVTLAPKDRSPRLEAIDDAVENAQEAYKAGYLPLLEIRLGEIGKAVRAWRASKLFGPRGVRSRKVNEVARQAAVLTTQVRDWQGDEFDAAITKHAVRRARVQAWLEEGRDEGADLRLRNSCDWLLRGRAKLYVLTDTADAGYRAQVRLELPNPKATEELTCYFPNPKFGPGALLSTPVAYNPRNAADTSNVLPHSTRSNGWSEPGYVVVTETPFIQGATDDKRKDLVLQVVRHEVQHLADKTLGSELSAGVEAADADSPEETFQLALRRYKTEYRAHMYMRDPDIDIEPHDPDRTIRVLDLDWTDRQWDVVKRIRKLYPDIAAAWGKDEEPPTASQQRFREAVNAYQDPDMEGFNKINSIRIDKLYNALDAVPAPTDNPEDAHVVAVLAIVAELRGDDVGYLQDSVDLSPMFRRKIERHLTDRALDEFDQALGRGNI